MLSQIPFRLNALRNEDLDREILRAALIAELDAAGLYEQMAALTQNRDIRKILFDVAREEKTHVGEFQALLLKMDPEQAEEMRAGAGEVDEKTASPKRSAA